MEKDRARDGRPADDVAGAGWFIAEAGTVPVEANQVVVEEAVLAVWVVVAVLGLRMVCSDCVP